VTLAWHPFEKTLAVGWENGALSLWLEERLQFVETVSPHQAPIGLLGWSSQGSRLLTGDTVKLKKIFQWDYEIIILCFKDRNGCCLARRLQRRSSDYFSKRSQGATHLFCLQK